MMLVNAAKLGSRLAGFGVVEFEILGDAYVKVLIKRFKPATRRFYWLSALDGAFWLSEV